MIILYVSIYELDNRRRRQRLQVDWIGFIVPFCLIQNLCSISNAFVFIRIPADDFFYFFLSIAFADSIDLLWHFRYSQLQTHHFFNIELFGFIFLELCSNLLASIGTRVIHTSSNWTSIVGERWSLHSIISPFVWLVIFERFFLEALNSSPHMAYAPFTTWTHLHSLFAEKLSRTNIYFRSALKGNIESKHLLAHFRSEMFTVHQKPVAFCSQSHN